MTTYGDQIQQAVRAQIRAEIAANGMKQADVARALTMQTSTLSRYLNDSENRDMPYKVFAEIARALNLTPRELAERAERRLEGRDVS